MEAGVLRNAIVDAGCPVLEARVVDPNNRATWSFMAPPGTPQTQVDIGNNIINTISTVVLNVIRFSDFVQRWTTTELSNLYKGRATAITNNGAGMTLVKQWDVAQAQGYVDLNTAAAQNFKAAIVTAGILTQQRADVVFG